MKTVRTCTPTTSGLILFLAIIPAPVSAQPNTIYAVNNYVRDSTDQDLFLHTWKRMGFLNATSGRPAERQANGDLRLDGMVVGKEITRDGRVIGWRNADGTLETYDLSGGAVFKSDCWERVRNGGTIDIMKHGLLGNQHWTNGGALHLDASRVGEKGEWFNGFKKAGADGNGSGRLLDTSAYELPARENANIDVVFTVCFAGNRPRKNGGDPRPSVADTVQTVPGVNRVTASTQAVTSGVSIGVEGLNAQAQAAVPIAYVIMYAELVNRRLIVEDKCDTLDRKVKKVNDWVYNLPALQRWTRLRALLDDLGFREDAAEEIFRMRPKVLPGTVEIPTILPDEGPSYMSTVLDQEGGTYDYSEGLLAGTWPKIIAAPDTLDAEVEVQAAYVAAPDLPPPPGLWPASLPVEITARRVDTSLDPVGGLTLALPFSPFFDDVRLFRFEFDKWAEVMEIDERDEHYGFFTLTPPRAQSIFQSFSDRPVFQRADYDRDGQVTGADFDAFIGDFQAGDIKADFDRDGFVTGIDFDEFSRAWKAAC